MGRNETPLEIIEHPLSDGKDRVGAYFFIDYLEDIAGLAIDPDSPDALKAAYEIEALGYHEKRPPKGGRKFILESSDVGDLDPNAILAIRSVIEDVRPGWVEEVKD
ncbi:MAG: hypothetical protein ACRDSJ_10505, partial [Rubrobacteraceae bacterium]